MKKERIEQLENWMREIVKEYEVRSNKFKVNFTPTEVVDNGGAFALNPPAEPVRLDRTKFYVNRVIVPNWVTQIDLVDLVNRMVLDVYVSLGENVVLSFNVPGGEYVGVLEVSDMPEIRLWAELYE